MAPVHKVAVIQWHIKNLAPDENHAIAVRYIEQAAAQGATLAVLPEYHLVGWAPENPLYKTLAADTSRFLTSYQSLARRLHINIVPGTIIEKHTTTTGAAGRHDEEEQVEVLYNTAYFIAADSGEIRGSYRKKNIWHPERPHLTSSGPDPHEVFDTAVGKVGLLICWDLAFPEAFRELIAKGAEIIIIPTYWGRTDASPAALALNPDSEKLFLESTLTARTFENTCAIVFANAAGPADRFLGLSSVVVPIRGPLVSMAAEEEGVALTELDIAVLAIAEDNYKVREDIASDGWHYSYRHDRTDVRPSAGK